MSDARAELEVETLLKIVLVLVLVLLVLEVVGALVGSLQALLGPFFIVVQLAIAVLIVLWLVDRL